jgi:hypothetical protein
LVAGVVAFAIIRNGGLLASIVGVALMLSAAGIDVWVVHILATNPKAWHWQVPCGLQDTRYGYVDAKCPKL